MTTNRRSRKREPSPAQRSLRTRFAGPAVTSPGAFYRQYIKQLGKPKKNGWALGLCPFHADTNPSLGVQLIESHGGWKCFAGCGSGDFNSFYQRYQRLPRNVRN